MLIVVLDSKKDFFFLNGDKLRITGTVDRGSHCIAKHQPLKIFVYLHKGPLQTLPLYNFSHLIEGVGVIRVKSGRYEQTSNLLNTFQ